MIDLYALIVTVWACAATVGFLIMWALYRRAWWEGWLERAHLEAQRIHFDTETWASREDRGEQSLDDLLTYHTGGDQVADLRPLPVNHPDE